MRKAANLLHVMLMSCGVMCWPQASSAADAISLDQLEGVYVVPGNATHQRVENGPFVPVKNATDCLVIKKVDSGEHQVYLSSIQARGAACYMEGPLRIKEGRIFYLDEGNPMAEQGVYLQLHEGTITLAAAHVGPLTQCGEHANIGATKFKLSAKRVPWRTRQSQAQALQDYCPKWNR